MKRLAPYIVSLVVLAGCAVGPDYQRPNVSVPANYRSQPSVDSQTIAEREFMEIYQDDVLQGYIAAALDSNLDLIAAYGRISEAGAQVTMAKADLYPQLSFSGDVGAMQMSKNRFPGFSDDLVGGVRGNFGLSAVLSWELDVFGRIRRTTEAQRALLAASEAGQRAAIVATIAAVSETYFQLREYDRLREILDSNLTSRREYARLARTLFEGGKSSELDYRQAEAELRRVEAQVPQIETMIQQTENALNVLIGRLPGTPVRRGRTLDEQFSPPEIPAGQPAGLLNRRPDVIEAEQQLVAANANIGVATAQLFPRIAVAGDAGMASLYANDLFDPNSLTWRAVGNVAQPLFNAGKNLARVDAAEGSYVQVEAQYRSVVLKAYREVNDELTAYLNSMDRLKAAQGMVDANREVLRLSELRYRYGTAPYLQVLDAQRSLLSAQSDLITTRGDQLRALVRLYRALGGGWNPQADQQSR